MRSVSCEGTGIQKSVAFPSQVRSFHVAGGSRFVLHFSAGILAAVGDEVAADLAPVARQIDR
jgi:hypothetical protein